MIALLAPQPPGGRRPSLLAPTAATWTEPAARLRPADTFGTFSLSGENEPTAGLLRGA